MKEQVLAALVTAKRLLNTSENLCAIREYHACSAGIVVLQDAVELVLLAILMELGLDETQRLERLTFDQMIGELRKKGITIPKSGTIKAMNKHRVLVKHYGQTVDPDTASRYFSASRQAVDSVLADVLGKNLVELFLHNLVSNAESREHLDAAMEALQNKRYFNAMIAIRKALFIEIEQDYCIYGWRDHQQSERVGIFGSAFMGGLKAPYYTRNKAWIEANVREPFDYIQLDHGGIRSDLVEWGVNTQDFWNVWRLTPPVFRADKESSWQVKREPNRFAEGATESNVQYCLDATITLILKKQDHFDLGKFLTGSISNSVEIETCSNPTNVYVKAATTSEVKGTVPIGTRMKVSSVVPGLGTDDKFVYVFPMVDDPINSVFGYVLISDVLVADES